MLTTQRHLGGKAGDEAVAQVAHAADVDVAHRVVIGARKDREEVEVLRGSLHGVARALQAASETQEAVLLPSRANAGHVLPWGAWRKEQQPWRPPRARLLDGTAGVGAAATAALPAPAGQRGRGRAGRPVRQLWGRRSSASLGSTARHAAPSRSWCCLFSACSPGSASAHPGPRR